MRHWILLLTSILLSHGLIAQTVTKVSSQEARSLLSDLDERSSVIIDGRTPEMYKAGHIKNAVNINAFDEDAKQQLVKYMDKKQLVVYCTTQNRSKKIIETLKNLNYSGEVFFIPDGVRGWEENGYEVFSDNPKTQTGSNEEKSNLSDKLNPIVQVFGVSSYNIEESHYSYGFGRAHLGFQYQFNEDWSAKMIIDRGRPTSVGQITVTDTAGNNMNVTQPTQEGSYYTMTLKFATLAWQVTPKLRIEGGGILQNHYITQERFWGYRYIAKTFQDRYFHTPSGDLGFIAYYQLNKTFSIDAALTNGEGFRSDQDPYGKVKSTAGLDINPGNHFQSRIYYANKPSGDPVNDATQELVSVFAGYRLPEVFRLGGEYNYHINHHNMEGKELHGYSLFGSYKINDETSLFARFDNLTSNTLAGQGNAWNHQGNGKAVITGIHHSPVNNVNLSFNYKGWIPESNELDTQHQVMLNFEFKW